MHDLNWGFTGDQLPHIPSVSIAPHGSSLGEQQLPNEQPKRLLENLNCVGCPNIKKVVIPMAQGFLLSSLNVSLSANLKEVEIACYNLCILNLRYML